MMRLDKLLAHSGYGSRKEVKELIRRGYVSVNEEIIKDDDFKIDETNDEIVVDGFKVGYQKYAYYMLNKPAGVVSATYDGKYKTVLDLIDDPTPGLFPVGRLDIDTEGLLLICNDGELAHNLLSPKKHVDKKYYIRFKGKMPVNGTDLFKKGIIIDDGYQCKPAILDLLAENECCLTISEGKFHQVKRMFISLNMEVVYLKRISFASLNLDENLSFGQFRELTTEELNKLKSS